MSGSGSVRAARRLAIAVLAVALAVAPSACGRSFLGVGKTIEGVTEDSIAMNLVLIGDAGLPAPDGDPVLQALRREISWDPRRTFVVFLGDNIYPHGLPDSSSVERAEAERILRDQMKPLLETGTRGIFVPGNHDWDAGSPDGWRYIIRQDRFVAAEGKNLVRLAPSMGCPGPVTIDFGDYLRLVALDTEWWLQGAPPLKPYGPNAPCGAATESEIVDSLRVTLATAGTKRTVVVAHHPLVSGGEHGGYFDWPTYLFPFHPWARLSGVFARQDVSGREYRAMRTALERAFAPNPPLVYAAGHEHNLQVFRRPPARFQLVSGAGIFNHTTAVRAITGTMYTRRASGYMRLTILTDGRVRLSVQVVNEKGEATEDYSAWLETRRIERAVPVVPGAAEQPAPATTTAPAPAPPSPPSPSSLRPADEPG